MEVKGIYGMLRQYTDELTTHQIVLGTPYYIQLTHIFFYCGSHMDFIFHFIYDKCTFSCYFFFENGIFSACARARMLKSWIKWMETASVIFFYWRPIVLFCKKWNSKDETKKKNWAQIQIDHDLCNALCSESTLSASSVNVPNE